MIRLLRSHRQKMLFNIVNNINVQINANSNLKCGKTLTWGTDEQLTTGNLMKRIKKSYEKSETNCVTSFIFNFNYFSFFCPARSSILLYIFFSRLIYFFEIERNSIQAHDELQTKCGELCNYQTVNTLNQNYSAGTGSAL